MIKNELGIKEKTAKFNVPRSCTVKVVKFWVDLLVCMFVCLRELKSFRRPRYEIYVSRHEKLCR